MTASATPKRWSHALTIWWAMMWRFTLLLLLCMGIGMKLGQWAMPEDIEGQHAWEMILFALLLPVLGIYAVRAVLNRDFGAFRLVLLPPEGTVASGQVAAPQHEIQENFDTESKK